jgi:heptosyltransferase-3
MKRILVVRTDNIGDLVCTTPMLAALRREFPGAWIGVLANSYNGAVLQGNPDVDEIFSYRKAKHREPGESRWSVWLETAGVLWKLRRKKIDVAILASPSGERHARLIGARRTVAAKPSGPMHEVERCMALVEELGVRGSAGAPTVIPDRRLAEEMARRAGLGERAGVRVGVHISARRPKQRWPESAFTDLVGQLLESGEASQVLLFWSPGREDDPAHPGDDGKLEKMMEGLAGRPVYPIRTSALGELVAGLSLCDAVICADGGAMHVAAGLGKPMVCLFGDSDPVRWHPWGVPHELLQLGSKNVADISVEEVMTAVGRLLLPQQAG